MAAQRFHLYFVDLKVTAPITWDDERAEAVMDQIEEAVRSLKEQLAVQLRHIDQELEVK